MSPVRFGEYEVWAVQRVKDEDDMLDVTLRDDFSRTISLRMEAKLAPCIASVVSLSWTERK